MKKRKLLKEVLFGVHPIIEMLRARRRELYSLYVLSKHSSALSKVKKLLGNRKPNIQYVTAETLAKLAGTDQHMGIVALVSPFSLWRKRFIASDDPIVIVLDGIQDVRNLGAILRTAYCFGIKSVMIVQKRL